MRRRFFIDRFDQGRATLRGESAHHLESVLRAQPGQLYELSDRKEVWLGKVRKTAKDSIEFTLVERVAVVEPRVQISLLLSIVKFDRFEWALEKASELGVAEIVPLGAARSERRLVVAAGKRAERWERILLEAAQQSRRLGPPILARCTRPQEAFRKSSVSVKLLLSERPESPPAGQVLANARATSAALAIGPEGGWTDEEFAAARATGFAEISVGPNILRTETAVVAGLAILHYALGD